MHSANIRHHADLIAGAVWYRCPYHPNHEEADRYKPNPWLLSLAGQTWSEHPSLWYKDGSKSLHRLKQASRAPGYNTLTDYLMLLDLPLCLVLFLLVWTGLTHSNTTWPVMVGCDIKSRTLSCLPLGVGSFSIGVNLLPHCGDIQGAPWRAQQ